MEQIQSFDWNRENKNHIARHGVALEEAEEVVIQALITRRARDGQYLTYGKTENGRYLLVVYRLKSYGKAKVITARDMTAKEKRFCRTKK